MTTDNHATTAITPNVDIAERLRIHADAIEDGTPVPYGKMGEVQRRAADEIEALRALVVQAHRDSWSDDGEQMWACRGLLSLSDEQAQVLLRALQNGSTREGSKP